MFAVAVLAMCMGFERLARRRAYFLERAAVEADRAIDFGPGGMACLRPEVYREGIYEELYAYHVAQADRYRLAASRPWLPLGPEPRDPIERKRISATDEHR